MDDTVTISNQFSEGWIQFFALIGVILLVVIGLFIWAVFLRRTKKRRRKHRHHHSSYREKLEKGANDIKEIVEERRHRHRHGHRPVNPTLAETGGLPPRRPPDEPPPGA
ncbi:MAG: hypothetical protein ACLQSR_16430 [Limisphaerales bacterium]